MNAPIDEATDIPVQFITKTKLPRFNEEAGRHETITYEPGDKATLPAVSAYLAIGNGWAREVTDNA